MNMKTDEGARVYTPLTLKLYDWWVLNFSNDYAWRCPTKRFLLPHFLRNLSSNHLDVGVGTGYYLTHAPDDCAISLLDLNNSSLEAASARAGKPKIKYQINHDVFETYPAHLNNQFDSISMFYLLHCLPGTMANKAIVIGNAKMALTDDGVLYGATILGNGVNHNSFGKLLMNTYNSKGIFSNKNDSEASLRKILSDHFETAEVRVIGTVAVFSASGKK